MDYKHIAKAEQTLEALSEAINVLEQQEKIRSNLSMYNYSLFELNKARAHNEVTYNFAEKRFSQSRNFRDNEMNRYRTRARDIVKNQIGNIEQLSYKQIFELMTTSNS